MPVLIALALFLLVGQAHAAPTIKCEATPPQVNTYVNWRLIDGRRCYYIGRRLDKSLLYWEPEKPIEVEEMPLPAEAPPVRAQEMPSEFEDRWQGLYDHRTARDSQPLQQWRLWE